MKKTDEIMGRVCPSWGICRFEQLKPRLIDCRGKSRIPENAESVITAVFPYLLSEENYKNSNISKYAVVNDYHTVINARLAKAVEALRLEFPDEQFVTFTDNSPIPEVSAALLSGLGVIGDNSLFIHKDYGTYVFIGEIVTTMKLEPTGGEIGHCLHCGKCASACPGGAIKDGQINASRCLSAISQKKGELTEEEKELIIRSGCAWGCDICQNVCPLNTSAKLTDIEEFIAGAIPVVSEGCSVEGRAYEWRGRKVIERNIRLLSEQKE